MTEGHHDDICHSKEAIVPSEKVRKSSLAVIIGVKGVAFSRTLASHIRNSA